MQNLISIVLRTKNEEFWIGRFMEGVKEQICAYDVEIVLVDNGSTDRTVAKARKMFDRLKLVTIDEYIPGAALNRGVEAANGDYIVCVSAHCVPANQDWLSELLEPLKDPNVAAVYGRQIPMLTSNPKDKRDLWLTFGLDDKIQSRDPFLHNANAGYRRADLLQHPFSETMSNIEDRRWGNYELKQGRKIYYASKAVVYHDHGIHQSGSQSRLNGVIAMMDELHQNFDQFEHYYGVKGGVVPPSLCLIVPISHRYGHDDIHALTKYASEIKVRFKDWTVFIMPSLPDHIEIAREYGFEVLDFRVDPTVNAVQPLVMDISKAVNSLTEQAMFFDYIGTFDIRRWLPTEVFLERALSLIQSEQADAAIGAVHKPKPTFLSTTGEAFQMEYSGWLNWLDSLEVTKVPVLDPSAFILAKMDVFRKGNPLQSKFCSVELDE